jgi:hypothetical protein
MNIKALSGTKEYRAFAKKFKKPKALNDLGVLKVHCEYPDSSIVNTALDILVRFDIFAKTKAEKHEKDSQFAKTSIVQAYYQRILITSLKDLISLKPNSPY